MNCRQFFKTVAAIFATRTATVVAPVVVVAQGGKKENPDAMWTVTVNGKVIELSQAQYDEIYWYARHDIIKMLEDPE